MRKYNGIFVTPYFADGKLGWRYDTLMAMCDDELIEEYNLEFVNHRKFTTLKYRHFIALYWVMRQRFGYTPILFDGITMQFTGKIYATQEGCWSYPVSVFEENNYGLN